MSSRKQTGQNEISSALKQNLFQAFNSQNDKIQALSVFFWIVGQIQLSLQIYIIHVFYKPEIITHDSFFGSVTTYAIKLLLLQDTSVSKLRTNSTQMAFDMLYILMIIFTIIFVITSIFSILSATLKSKLSLFNEIWCNFQKELGYIMCIMMTSQLFMTNSPQQREQVLNVGKKDGGIIAASIFLLLVNGLAILISFESSTVVQFKRGQILSKFSCIPDIIDFVTKLLLSFQLLDAGSLFSDWDFTSFITTFLLLLKLAYIIIANPYQHIDSYEYCGFSMSIQLPLAFSLLFRIAFKVSIELISIGYIIALICPLFYQLFRNQIFNKALFLLSQQNQKIKNQYHAFLKVSLLEKIFNKAHMTLFIDKPYLSEQGNARNSSSNHNNLFLQLFYGILNQHCKSNECYSSLCPCHALTSNIKYSSKDTIFSVSKSKMEAQSFSLNKINENLANFKEHYLLTILEELQESIPESQYLKLTFADMVTQSIRVGSFKAINVLSSIKPNNASYKVLMQKNQIYSAIEAKIQHSDLQKLSFSLTNEQNINQSKTEANIKHYLDCRSAFEEFQRNIIEVSQQTNQFWKLFQDSEFKTSKLYQVAKKVNKLAEDVEIKWIKIKNNFQNLIWKEYGLYGIYELIIRNSLTRGRQAIVSLNKRTHELQHKLSQENQICSSTIIDNKNVILEIYMTKEKLGIIKNLTGDSRKLIGLTTKEIIGQDLTILQPSFFTNHHKGILRKLSQQIDSKIEQEGLAVSTFSKCKDGTIKPVNILIKPKPYIKQEFTYMCILRPIICELHYLIVNENGQILEMSSHFAKTIGNSEYKDTLKSGCKDFNYFNKIYNLNVHLESLGISQIQIQNSITSDKDDKVSIILNKSKIAQILNLSVDQIEKRDIYVPSSIADYDRALEIYNDFKDRGREIYINFESGLKQKYKLQMKSFDKNEFKTYKILEFTQILNLDETNKFSTGFNSEIESHEYVQGKDSGEFNQNSQNFNAEDSCNVSNCSELDQYNQSRQHAYALDKPEVISLDTLKFKEQETQIQTSSIKKQFQVSYLNQPSSNEKSGLKFSYRSQIDSQTDRALILQKDKATDKEELSLTNRGRTTSDRENLISPLSPKRPNRQQEIGLLSPPLKNNQKFNILSSKDASSKVLVKMLNPNRPKNDGIQIAQAFYQSSEASTYSKLSSQTIEELLEKSIEDKRNLNPSTEKKLNFDHFFENFQNNPAL